MFVQDPYSNATKVTYTIPMCTLWFFHTINVCHFYAMLTNFLVADCYALLFHTSHWVVTLFLFLSSAEKRHCPWELLFCFVVLYCNIKSELGEATLAAIFRGRCYRPIVCSSFNERAWPLEVSHFLEKFSFIRVNHLTFR